MENKAVHSRDVYDYLRNDLPNQCRDKLES